MWWQHYPLACNVPSAHSKFCVFTGYLHISVGLAVGRRVKASLPRAGLTQACGASIKLDSFYVEQQQRRDRHLTLDKLDKNKLPGLVEQ